MFWVSRSLCWTTQYAFNSRLPVDHESLMLDVLGVARQPPGDLSQRPQELPLGDEHFPPSGGSGGPTLDVTD